MKEYNEKILQVIKDEFLLQEVLHPNFIKKIKENFGDDEIIPINLSLVSKNQPKMLTLSHPTHRHTENKELVVDVDFPEDLDKLYSSLDFEDNYG